MKKILPNILFLYSAIASILITISLVFTGKSVTPVVFALLFLPVTGYFVTEFFTRIRAKQTEPIRLKKSEVIVMGLIFLLLIGIGINNVSKLPQSVPTASPAPLIFKAVQTGSPSPKKTVQIAITDGSESVNIREKPTIYSDKVGEAKDGDTFNFIASKEGWYELEMASGSGYISGKYIKQ